MGCNCKTSFRRLVCLLKQHETGYRHDSPRHSSLTKQEIDSFITYEGEGHTTPLLRCEEGGADMIFCDGRGSSECLSLLHDSHFPTSR